MSLLSSNSISRAWPSQTESNPFIKVPSIIALFSWLFSESNFNLAEKYLTKASESKIDPNMAQISCRVLGDLYINNNQPIKATLQYEKCLQYGPISELVINGLEKAKQMINDNI